jgi:hypothetical protein
MTKPMTPEDLEPKTIESIAEMARKDGWAPKDVHSLMDYMTVNRDMTPEQAAAQYDDLYGPHKFPERAKHVASIQGVEKPMRAQPNKPEGDQRSRLAARAADVADGIDAGSTRSRH